MFRARLRSCIRGIFGRCRFEKEISDEFQFHIQTRADDLRRIQGLSHEEAARLARIEFGSIEKCKEQSRPLDSNSLTICEEMSHMPLVCYGRIPSLRLLRF